MVEILLEEKLAFFLKESRINEDFYHVFFMKLSVDFRIRIPLAKTWALNGIELAGK